MKTLLVVALLCFSFLGVVNSKHTLHVDNVYANFGETILISGPFTTDDIVPDVLNVGDWTILSDEGLSLTTEGSTIFEGSRFDASTVNTGSISAENSLSLIAAASLGLHSETVNLVSDGRLEINSIGSGEILADERVDISAGSFDFTGDFLSVSSAAGTVDFFALGSLTSSSASLNVDATHSVRFSGEANGLLSARQSIEGRCGSVYVSADDLNIVAERQNILVNGNTGMDIILVQDLDITTKGGAIIAASDGHLDFVVEGDVNLLASDDLQLNAIDSFVMKIARDVNLDSSGSTYFLADHGSQYEFDHGRLIAEETIQQFSARHFMETTTGDIDFNVFFGSFNSTAVEFTNFFATQSISFDAFDYIRFIGEQDFDMRAERGSLYFTPAGPNAPNQNIPFYFYAKNDATFQASDMLMNTQILSIVSDYARFETEDTARYSQNSWTLSGDLTFDVDSFSLGSAQIELSTNGDMVISASDNIILFSYFQVGAEILLDTSFRYVERADNDITWQVFDTFHWNTERNTLQVATFNYDIESESDIRFVAGSTLTATCVDHFTHKTNLDAHYLSPYRGSTHTFTAVDNIDLHGGYFQLQVLDTWEMNSNAFYVQAAPNIDLVSNSQFSLTTDIFQANIDRYSIINGQQTWSITNLFSISGNTFLASPPGTDISWATTLFTVDAQSVEHHSGVLNVAAGSQIFLSSASDIDISTFSEGSIVWETQALSLTATEQLAFISVSPLASIGGDDYTDYPHPFEQFNYNYDNQFHFLASNSISINSFAFVAGALDTYSIYADSVLLQSINLNLEAQIVEVTADQLVVISDSVIDLSSVHFLDLYSQRSSIDISAEQIDYSAGENAFIYTSGTASFRGNNDILTSAHSFSYEGGDLQSNSAINTFVSAGDDFTILGFEEVTVNPLDALELRAAETLIITSPEVYFDATDFITVNGETFISDSAQGDIISLAASTSLDITSSSTIDFLSNDEYLVNILDGSYSVTATSPNDPIFLRTSFQDSGIISYAAGQLDILTLSGNSFFDALDDSLTGGNIEFESSATFISSLGPVESGIFIQAVGSNYDENLSRYVGVLHRSISGNIGITAGEETYYNANRELFFLSTADSVIHSSATDIDMLTTGDGGFIAQSANDFAVTTNSGSITNTLTGNSLWKAADRISTLSDGNYRLVSGESVHYVADRGDVTFNYRGSSLLDFTAQSFDAQTASTMNFALNGVLSVTASSLVNIYADTGMTIFSNGPTGSRGIATTSGRNSFYKSSNGISFDSSNDNLSLTTNSGWISQVASGDVIWASNSGGGNIFTGLTQTFTTLGSIIGEFENSINWASSSDFTAIARNTVEFEAISSIDIGTPSVSIITINTGGHSIDNGVFISAVGAVTHNSDNNINIAAHNYNAVSHGSQTLTGLQVSIESQGTDSIGKDVTIASALNLNVDAGTSITLTGTSIRYLYDNALSFSGVSTKIDSSTFIDLQSSDQLSLTQSGAWTLNSNALTFTSLGDSTWNIGTSTSFTTTQGISSTSTGTTYFQSLAGTVNFQTNLGSSPITFESQHPTSDFVIEASNAIGFTTTSKVSITGKNGLSSFSHSTIGFSAADEFSADSTGDLRMLAAGISSDISFTGTDPSGSGSRVSFTSTGTLIEQFDRGQVSSRNQNWAPDVDLTFESLQVSDLGALFTVTTTDDLTADFTGSWNYNTGATTFSAVDTFDYQAFGINSEREFGMSFTSLKSSIQATANGGSIYFTPKTGLYVTGDNNQFSASSTATFTSIGDQTFTATENPTGVFVNSGEDLLISAATASFSATGDEPTSGVISLFTSGFQINPAYPSKQDTYSVAFIANNNANFLVPDARFVMEEMTFGTIVPTFDGSVLFEASGYDEFGKGIEITSGNILVTSETNVVLRAANINMIEIPHDPYYGAAIDNSGKYLEALNIDFQLTRHRPTILSVGDQVYSSLGRNINGNGIELTSTVPGADIVFAVDSLNVNSDATAQFLANSLVKITSRFDSQIVSLNSVYITAHGKSSNPPGWDDSIHVRVGSRDPASFTNGALIGFTPKRDLYMDSFDTLEALITSSTEIAGAGVNFASIAESGYSISGDAATYTGEANLSFSSGDNIFVEAGNNLNIVAQNIVRIGSDSTGDYYGYRDGRTDVYFGTDKESVGDSSIVDVSIAANNVEFYSSLVDFSSTVSLVFPIFQGDPSTVPFSAGRFYLQEDTTSANRPAICVHSNNAPNARYCYRLFFG